MEVKAVTTNVRMSAQKMREVVRQIQGLPALQAQAVLANVPRKSARVVAKNPEIRDCKRRKQQQSQARNTPHQGGCRRCWPHVEALHAQGKRLGGSYSQAQLPGSHCPL